MLSFTGGLKVFVALEPVDLRLFGLGKHRNVDDTPAGGGAGMDADIAAALDCTTGTVKQHLSRARHSLAETLGLDPKDES